MDNNTGVKAVRVFMFKSFNAMDQEIIDSGVAYHVVSFASYPSNERMLLELQPLLIFGELNHSTQCMSFTNFEYFQLTNDELNRILVDGI